MFGLGFSEVILLGVLALIIIGPKQLPDVARTIGRFLNELRRATEDLKDEVKRSAKVDLDMNSFSLRPDPPKENSQMIEAPVEPIQNTQLDLEEQKRIEEAYQEELGGHHDKQISMDLDQPETKKKES